MRQAVGDGLIAPNVQLLIDFVTLLLSVVNSWGHMWPQIFTTDYNRFIATAALSPLSCLWDSKVQSFCMWYSYLLPELCEQIYSFFLEEPVHRVHSLHLRLWCGGQAGRARGVHPSESHARLILIISRRALNHISALQHILHSNL